MVKQASSPQDAANRLQVSVTDLAVAYDGLDDLPLRGLPAALIRAVAPQVNWLTVASVYRTGGN
jgi:hypothetical protein